MHVSPLTELDQIRQGDALLLSDGQDVISANAELVKVTEHDGTEVIFDVERNRFFNVGMYLSGKSWVKDARVARIINTGP